MLLRVPLSSFVTKRSVSKGVVKEAPGVSLHGLLALHLCLEKARGEPATAQWRSVFPSPEDLKNKIIISTKPPKEYLESKDTKSNGSVKGSSRKLSAERISIEEYETGGKDLSDSKSEA